jgi:hypothetical protein
MPKYTIHDVDEPQLYHLSVQPGNEPGTVFVTAKLGLVLSDPETSVSVELNLTQLKELVAQL